jgi:predicted deacylase
MQLNQFKSVILIPVILLLFAICAFVYYELYDKSQPIVVEQVEEKKLIQNKQTIGTSVEGRDIAVYHYGSGQRRLTFVGGIHGGYEWNSVLLAYTLLDYFDMHNESIPKNLTIDIIPNANPDAVYKVTGKEGRFTIANVTNDTKILESARFNSHAVDLNRNFECKWQSKSTWRKKEVSGGSGVFSEPEVQAIRSYMLTYHPDAVIFWHSQANAVYASACEQGPLKDTLRLMDIYSAASGYPAIKTFDAYPTTGAADDWLAHIGIPAITVELSTHESIEWEKNLKGVQAVLQNYVK